MQKLWWPGYGVQLLRELQRQQNCSQFCDTLLQAEGISVPTHSCVLAALSPHLSQKLSASPSPPRGQKRCLQLQTVTAQTLLKLVGLLYSGELEVRGIKEQNEVLAAAHQFGIGDLVLGCKNGNATGGNCVVTGFHTEQTRIRHRNLKMRDAQVQNHPSAKEGSLVSVSTRTVEAGGMTALSPEQSPPVVTPLQPQILQLSKELRFTPHPTIHSGDDQTVQQPSDSVPNLTSSSTSSTSLEGERSPLRSQEENASQQLSEPGDRVANERRGDGRGNDKLTEGGRSTEQLGQVNGDETANKTENSGSLCDECEIPKENSRNNAPIYVKVKLRRTKEEAWEVVNSQHREASGLTAAKQKKPQTDLSDLQNPAPPGLMLQNLETPDLHPEAPEAPGPSSTSSDSDPHSSATLNQSLQSQGPGEESQEDMNWILEDIMMALNILPKAQASHDGVLSSNQITDNGTESPHMQDLVPEAGCVFYQDSSADAVVHYCIGAQNQNQPSCTGLSARSDLPTQQQSSEFNSPGTLTETSHGTTFQGSQSSPYPQPGYALTSDPPGLQQLSSQNSQNILGSLAHEAEAQSSRTSLSCLKDLRIPQPLSPLEPRSPDAQQRPSRSHNPENDVRPALPQQPWLTEPPRLLQLPISVLSDNKTGPVPRRGTSSCGSELLDWKPESWDSCAESSTVGVVEDSGTESDPGGGSAPQKRQRQRRSDAAEGSEIPRKRIRKRKNLQQASEDLGAAIKKLKVCEGATAVSPVRSSCSGVPVEESQAASKSSDKPRTCPRTKMVPACAQGEPREVESLRAEQTRIRTRSFVKMIQENISDKIQENCVLVPVVCRAVIRKEQAVIRKEETVTLLKRGRGRPRKIRPVETPSNRVPEEPESMSRDKVHEQQADEESSKVEEDGERKKRGRKARNRAKNAGAAHPREAGSAEGLEKAGEETPRQSLMATLKKFQCLIKQQHSMTVKSTEIQETDKFMREVEKREDGSDKDVEMEDRDLPDGTVDENHNQSVVTSAATDANKLHQDVPRDPGPAASDGVQEDDGVQVSPDREQLLQNPVEGGSDALQVLIKDKGTTCADTSSPEAAIKAHDCNGQKTGTPSPKEHDCLTRAFEGELCNASMTPDNGEEEEDSNEIDVTGVDTE
ncbi:uncharacterized protein [Nothobranchius furzeri]